MKTTLGLFTDTQDMEFVHTWALLPQSVYPTDLRATTIAHVGGDVYGSVGLGKAGRLSYTLYGGPRPNDERGGYFLGTRDGGAPMQSYDTWANGADIRWTSPECVTVGYSYYGIGGHGVLKQTNINGTPIPGGGIPFRVDYTKSNTNAVYADFQRDKVRVYGEYWLTDSDLRFSWLPIAPAQIRNRMWYVAGSYRVHQKLEFGSYYNEFVDNRRLGFSPSNGIRGPVVAARVDVNKYWNVKVEGHFIDGYGSAFSLRSFYPSTNPGGLEERTNVFLIRTGLVF